MVVVLFGWLLLVALSVGSPVEGGVAVLLAVVLADGRKVLMGFVPLHMAFAKLPALYCFVIQVQSKSEFQGRTVILSFTVRSLDKKKTPEVVLNHRMLSLHQYLSIRKEHLRVNIAAQVDVVGIRKHPKVSW